jgi:broad specificity phosphatase PhoE
VSAVGGLLLVGVVQAAPAVAPAPARLCVMRHAEAWKNVPRPPPERQGAAGDALTPAGLAQAAAAWPEGASAPAWVWVSPAGRARETAAGLRGAPAARVEPALRPLDGVIAWPARLEAWAAGTDPRPAGGESLADGAARVAAAEAAAWAALGPGETGLWVTHGDVAALAIGGWEGRPLLERPGAVVLGHAERRCLERPPGQGASGR